MEKRLIFPMVLIFSLSLGFLPAEYAPSARAAQKEITIRVGDLTAAEIEVHFRMAMENKYFEQEGIRLETKYFLNGPTTMLAMASGEIDLCVSIGFIPMIQAASQGSDLKIITSMTKGQAPVVAAGNIKTFKDLNGKTIGTPGLGSYQNTMLSIAAKKYGISFKKIVHGKITDLPVFLEKGELDAFAGWEWLAADAVNRIKGVHYVLKQPVVEGAECNGIAAYGKFYRENPEAVKKFLRAYFKGVKYFNENQDKAAAYLAKSINKPEIVGKMALEGVILNKPEINVAHLKFQIEDGIESKRIKKEAIPNVDEFLAKFIDQRLAKEAAKEVGVGY
jgi:NitT/TauT family transport system substrate-binding protein